MLFFFLFLFLSFYCYNYSDDTFFVSIVYDQHCLACVFNSCLLSSQAETNSSPLYFKF